MTLKNIDQKWMKSTEVKKIFAALGHENTRFVGGCIRNAILKEKITDIDIATSLIPEEVIKKLNAKKIRVIPTGIKHGTVTALVNKKHFEITTLRKDVECDGRHATVVFTDKFEEDAARRDFTINAMSCSIDGTIFDYFGGLADLDKRLIRFVGNPQQRCREDYLRILRFFRFFAYYGNLPIDKKSLKACKDEAKNISNLSGERIQAEMYKLLLADNLAQTISIMDKAGVLEHTLTANEIDIKKLENLVKIEKENKIKPDKIRRLSALIKTDSLTKNNLNDLAKRWKLSNNDKKLLNELSLSKIIIDPSQDEIEHKKIIRRLEYNLSIDIILLNWASNPSLNLKKALQLAIKWKRPKFPINGSDIKNLGIIEGRELGKLLQKSEKWWEDNNFSPNKKSVLEYLKTII